MNEGCIGTNLFESSKVIRCFHDESNCFRVFKDPLNLAGCTGFVNGDKCSTGKPHSEVNERPLVAGFAHQSYAVTWLNATCYKTLCEGDNLVIKLCGGDVFPAAIYREGKQSSLGSFTDPIKEYLSCVGLRISGNECGCIELNNARGHGKLLCLNYTLVVPPFPPSSFFLGVSCVFDWH